MNPTTRRPSAKMSASQAGAAFTLIELLVVIAIIAILAAILFPVFAQARDKARSASCLSNMKQIATAALMYVQDYDEMFPLTYILDAGYLWDTPVERSNISAANLPYYQSYWSNAILPYVKNNQVWACPSVSERDVFAEGLTRAAARGYALSYPMNGYLNHWPLAGSPAPATVIAFSEGLGKQSWVGYGTSFPLPLSTSGTGTDASGLDFTFNPGTQGACGANVAGAYAFPEQTDKTVRIHSEGSNNAYMDGHVKWVRHRSDASPWWSVTADGMPEYIWVADPNGPHRWCSTWFYQYGPVIEDLNEKY